MCTRYDIGYYLFLRCTEKEVKGTILEVIGNLFRDTCVLEPLELGGLQRFWRTEVNLPEGWIDLPKQEAIRQAIFAWKVSLLADSDESPV